MTNEQREAVEIVLVNRNYIYQLLYQCFAREPDDELLNILCGAGEAFSLLSEEQGDILSRCPKFFDAISAERAEGHFLEETKAEYTRLFVGPLSLVAPPWESVYGGEDALLFQEETLRVREFYKRFGLLPEAYQHVADDSLALELAFMSKLSERAVNMLKQYDTEMLKRLLEGSEEFLKLHLLRWIPKFLKRMEKSPTQILYPQLCLVLDAFLKADAKVLQELLALL